MSINDSKNYIFEQRSIAIFIIVLAIAVFILTWVSISENRSDSYQLLVSQGKGYVETLTSAAENAISSEVFFDQLTHKRYHDIIIEPLTAKLSEVDNNLLSRLIYDHDLFAISIYKTDSTLYSSATSSSNFDLLPEYVNAEIKSMIDNPINNYLLLFDDENNFGGPIHYYLELSNRMDRLVVVVANADYYQEAMEQTQIDYLAREMAREEGIEYIIYQTTDDIIFSSRKTNEVLAIESDSFLNSALDSDSVMYRRFTFQEKEILELVRPFSSRQYPYGLLRVGLSLDRYLAISRGYYWQMIILSLILFGMVTAFLLYVSSRRRRKEISREYSKMKSIADNIFEKMNTGVAALDKSGSFILTNDAFETMFNSKIEVGSQWDSVVTNPELSYSFLANSPGASLEEEIILEQGDNKIYLLAAVSKIFDDDKVYEGLVVVTSDITKVKELEVKTARRERLSEMGDLAAGVAHEIRNPLNTISIASQRLAGEFTPEENIDEYRQFTSQIKEETRRLNEIITRFLALTREDKASSKSSDVKTVLDEFCLLTKFEAERNNISILYDAAENMISKISSDGLKQILVNLYNNTKEALGGQRGEIRISAIMKDSKVELTFEDSGPGIPSQLHDKIMTPYYTTKESGTGLGLPTVYRIVTDSGGDVKIGISELGGAKFIITI